MQLGLEAQQVEHVLTLWLPPAFPHCDLGVALEALEVLGPLLENRHLLRWGHHPAPADAAQQSAVSKV